MKSHPWIRLFFYLGFAFLYIPIILIIVYSFNASKTSQWSGLSLHWYARLFQHSDWWPAAFTSLKLGVISATLAVIIGTTCAYLWTRPQGKHRWLGMVATSPLLVPELVAGLSLLLLFAWSEQLFGWPGRGWFAIIVAHTTLGAAYVTYIVRSRMENVPPTLREAALDLGAQPAKVFFLVQLPIIAPAIVASWLVAFILSFDDVVLVSFLAGPGITTLPSLIFSSIRVGYTPEINAMATCITGVLSVLILAAGYFLHHKDSP